MIQQIKKRLLVKSKKKKRDPIFPFLNFHP